jgi:hypothetical protein
VLGRHALAVLSLANALMETHRQPVRMGVIRRIHRVVDAPPRLSSTRAQDLPCPQLGVDTRAAARTDAAGPPLDGARPPLIAVLLLAAASSSSSW